MEHLKDFISIFLHLDQHLTEWTQLYGVWIYAILFLIIFCETGLVVTPILPGDSLLFAVGALAAKPDGLNLGVIMGLLFVAAVLGDTVNYFIGSWIGPKAFHYKKSWFFNPAHLVKAHSFYEKHGGKTIVIARFVPIVRTFAPFVAGIGSMNYRRFIAYNVAGAALWIGSIVMLGYIFGGFPIIQENFTLVIFAIIGFSILPIVYEWWKHRRSTSASRNSS